MAMPAFRFRAALLPLASAFLLACQSDPTGPLGPGSWGGTGASLYVGPDSTIFEFDCAHGVVRGLIDLDRGRFRLAGDYVLEGGPVSNDDPPETRNAVYAGTANGPDLWLSVEVDGFTSVVGPFVLRHGAAPLLRKCL
jgi:hypothetical protein